MTHRVLVAGASGYIGRHVVEALLQRDYRVVAQLRPSAQWTLSHPNLECVYGELTESAQCLQNIQACDFVISCLASRSGGVRDAKLVEYDANNRLLAAASQWGVQRFLLLSAICVQKPRLAFQKEKLRFEAKLRASNLPWTIIRPTAFFKSLSGQIARLQQGKSFLVFGNGTLTACKPIAEQDLAAYIVEQLTECISDRGHITYWWPWTCDYTLRAGAAAGSFTAAADKNPLPAATFVSHCRRGVIALWTRF